MTVQHPGATPRALAFASSLATSWTYERLLPSEAAFAEAALSLRDVVDLHAPAFPTLWPDWRTPSWSCQSDRGVDIEFCAAVSGAGDLLEELPNLMERPLAVLAMRIHRALFGRTWEESGRFRTVNLNVGVSWSFVATALRELDDDWAAWRAADSFETAIARLHARYEQAHPFEDGNGRSGRFLCDLLLVNAGRPPARWGSEQPKGRAVYLDALGAAFGTSIDPLARLVSG